MDKRNELKNEQRRRENDDREKEKRISRNS